MCVSNDYTICFRQTKLITSTDQNSTQNTEHTFQLVRIFNNKDNGVMCIIWIWNATKCMDREEVTICFNLDPEMTF